jgi:hypothetical protein
VYDYCDWEYWYGDGWCPFHERYDDCWWDYGYGGPGSNVPDTPLSVSVSASDGLTYSGNGGTIKPNTKLSEVGNVTLTAKDGYDIKTLDVTVKMGNTTLTPDTDYTVSEAGVITFKGDKVVSGTISISAKVEKEDVKVTISKQPDNVTVKVGSTDVTDSSYTLKYDGSVTFTIAASDGSELAITGDYTTITDNKNGASHSYDVTLSNVKAAATITIAAVSQS